nr:glycosyltransferase family 2 protein [Actinomycetota bacterium]
LGLLPPPSGRTITRIAKVSLERGVWTGGLLILLGIGCFIGALTVWGTQGFGSLDVLDTMRLPILGMVLMVTGFQLITVSFMLSLTKIGED